MPAQREPIDPVPESRPKTPLFNVWRVHIACRRGLKAPPPCERKVTTRDELPLASVSPEPMPTPRLASASASHSSSSSSSFSSASSSVASPSNTDSTISVAPVPIYSPATDNPTSAVPSLVDVPSSAPSSPFDASVALCKAMQNMQPPRIFAPIETDVPIPFMEPCISAILTQTRTFSFLGLLSLKRCYEPFCPARFDRSVSIVDRLAHFNTDHGTIDGFKTEYLVLDPMSDCDDSVWADIEARIEADIEAFLNSALCNE